VGLAKLLLSFRGRINRTQYWLVMFAYFIVCVVVVPTLTIHRQITFDMLVALQSFIGGMGGALFFARGGLTGGLTSIVGFLIFISALSVGAKRLHDRGKSAWWLVVFYGAMILIFIQAALAMVSGNFRLPLTSTTNIYFYSIIALVLQAWYFIDLGCLRGTPGPNRYGPDTLTIDAISAAPTA
jgi:uncharacterized membrane protein YhaH (DUF805 family)